MSTERRHMPDLNRLSVLLAAVLLAYALLRLIDREPLLFMVRLFGLDLSIPFDATLLAPWLVAGLSASGVDWLLRGHPRYDGRRTLQHWILPALTALVLGILLFNLSFGLAWWLSFALGGLLLLVVLLAEYIALDAADVRYPAATAGLVALSFALFVILVFTLAYARVRLLVLILAVFPAAGMVTLRAIHLQAGKWDLPWAFSCGFVIVQLAAAFHYWPISPVQLGLALLGPLYALTGLALNLHEAVSLRRIGLEAALGLAAFWAAALLLRS